MTTQILDEMEKTMGRSEAAPILAKALRRAVEALDFLTGECVTAQGSKDAAHQTLSDIESILGEREIG